MIEIICLWSYASNYYNLNLKLNNLKDKRNIVSFHQHFNDMFQYKLFCDDINKLEKEKDKILSLTVKSFVGLESFWILSFSNYQKLIITKKIEKHGFFDVVMDYTNYYNDKLLLSMIAFSGTVAYFSPFLLPPIKKIVNFLIRPKVIKFIKGTFFYFYLPFLLLLLSLSFRNVVFIIILIFLIFIYFIKFIINKIENYD